jgi:hypothetical protein
MATISENYQTKPNLWLFPFAPVLWRWLSQWNRRTVHLRQMRAACFGEVAELPRLYRVVAFVLRRREPNLGFFWPGLGPYSSR